MFHLLNKLNKYIYSASCVPRLKQTDIQSHVFLRIRDVGLSVTRICGAHVFQTKEGSTWRVSGTKRKDQTNKHIKGSKERYLLGQNTTCEFSGFSPLSSYKNDIRQQLNGEKRRKLRWRAKPLNCFWLSYVVFLSSAWKNEKPTDRVFKAPPVGSAAFVSPVQLGLRACASH